MIQSHNRRVPPSSSDYKLVPPPLSFSLVFFSFLYHFISFSFHGLFCLGLIHGRWVLPGTMVAPSDNMGRHTFLLPPDYLPGNTFLDNRQYLPGQ